ncbi:hypothetical protein HanPSC8_Chr15g0665601 [Helianthus annuus]|nr:hypothetical protein HanPSC8_Chr15g0665601 [Helianthus annuus]
MLTGIEIQWILASLLFSDLKSKVFINRVYLLIRARYFVDAGRRSSSTKNRTRYRYTFPHIATL